MIVNLSTATLSRYSRVIHRSLVKGEAHYETVCLDFAKGYLFFANPRIMGRIRLVNNGNEDWSGLKPIQLNGDFLLRIIGTFGNLTYDTEAKSFTTAQGDVLQLRYAKQIGQYVDMDEMKTQMQAHKLNLDNLKDLTAAIPFASPNSPSYSGVFLSEDRIVASDTFKFYEAIIENSNFGELKIHLDVLHTIANATQSGEIQNIDFYFNPTSQEMILSVNDGDCEIYTPQPLALSLPPVKDPRFIAQYNHPTSVVFRTHDFVSVLKFLQPFLAQAPNRRVLITVESETQLTIECKESNIIRRVLTLDECSPDLVGKHIWISSQNLIVALSVIQDEYTRFQLDPNQKAMNFHGVAKEEDGTEFLPSSSRHTIVVRLKE